MNDDLDRMPRSLWGILIAFGLFVLLIPIIFWFRQNRLEVCPRCALVREMEVWLVPFTQRSYYALPVERPTALHQCLKDLGYLDPHTHEWLLVQEDGPGDRERKGEGYIITYGLIPDSLALFVRRLHNFTDEPTVAYWFARMTHPEHAYVVNNLADQCARTNFPDGLAFRTWLTNAAAAEISMQRFRLGLNIHEPETRLPPRLLYERPPR